MHGHGAGTPVSMDTVETAGSAGVPPVMGRVSLHMALHAVHMDYVMRAHVTNWYGPTADHPGGWCKCYKGAVLPEPDPDTPAVDPDTPASPRKPDKLKKNTKNKRQHKDTNTTQKKRKEKESKKSKKTKKSKDDRVRHTCMRTFVYKYGAQAFSHPGFLLV